MSLTGLLLAEPATGQADEAAVEQPLLDDLVTAAVAGDVAARDDLIAGLYPPVLHYCQNRLRRRDPVFCSADDVAQEVFLAVVTALRSYVISDQPFRAFVYAIAAHKVTDAVRAMGRNRAVPVADVPDGPALQDGPEQRLLAGELAEHLGGLLQLLPLRQRKVLFLRTAVGLTAEETAEVLGSTPGSIRVTQHGALNRLRAAVSTVPNDQEALSGGR